MEEILTHETPAPKTEEAPDWEAAFRECVAEMDRVEQRMIHRQEEIETLKAETRAILSQINSA